MDKALLLHGWGGSANENWFPWLKKELYKKLFEVYIPNLPNTDKPVLEEQEQYIDIYASDFRKGGLIVGHSLGCKLAMNFIEENNIKNSIAILVAPTYPGLAEEKGKEVYGNSYDTLNAYFNSDLNFGKINNLNNKFVVFLSSDDPYINMENARLYYKKLKNIEFVEFENKGHFNKTTGVLELENILEYIK